MRNYLDPLCVNGFVKVSLGEPIVKEGVIGAIA